MEKKFIIGILVLQIITLAFSGYWFVLSEARYRKYEQSMKVWEEASKNYMQQSKRYEEAMETYSRQQEEYKKQAVPK